ncbi:MAG: sigma 54-interacting transcriptional regulator [Planctomycetota bacterium]
MDQEFVAHSPTMREVMQQIELVRDSAVAVLVTGERGTGREAVARAIHAKGVRKEQPFVHVDCAELPHEVMEAVLFGEREEGRFELAQGGTIYVESIDALPLALQERLLSVLERGVVERENGRKIVPVRARLIASTNGELRTLVDEGRFRRDLFCRLNVFPITLPPLRRRREDIALLSQAFLDRHRDERTPPVHAIEERALVALKSHDWPGNVKELEHVVLGAILACGPDRIVRSDNLPAGIRSGAPEAVEEEQELPPIQFEEDVIVPLSELERRAIMHALKVTRNNVTRAARALGIGRATMYRKLDRYKINQNS